MLADTALACPSCRRALPVAGLAAGKGSCDNCRTVFDFVPLPALHAKRSITRARSIGEGTEASCFFHVENQADAVCEGCGRFLCNVCSLEASGRCFCPGCFATRKDDTVEAVKTRKLYDRLALGLATVPLLVWPLTALTAPATLCVVIFCWKKPGSLMRTSRWRMVVAGIIALLEILVWAGVLLVVWLK